MTSPRGRRPEGPSWRANLGSMPERPALVSTRWAELAAVVTTLADSVHDLADLDSANESNLPTRPVHWRVHPGLPGLVDLRPRFTGPLVTLRYAGQCSIIELAALLGASHSATSQTVSAMAAHGLVDLSAGWDARTRVVALTPTGVALAASVDDALSARLAALAALFELVRAQGLLARLNSALTHQSLTSRTLDQLPGARAGSWEPENPFG